MFTPVETALGALLMYQGASGLLQHNGRVFGISGFLSGCLGQPSRDNLPIVMGLGSSIAPIYVLAPSLLPRLPTPPQTPEAALTTAAAGVLVGWGTKSDHGCTSGHMFCGISRLSGRSLIATGIFFTTALISSNLGLGGRIPSCVDAQNNSQPCYIPTYPTTNELVVMSAAVALSQLVNSVLVQRFLRRADSRKEDDKSAATAMATLYSYISGLQFGLGLLISGMANPAKVLGFFSWFDLRNFDPSLALVLLFGVGPAMLSYFKMTKEYGNEEGQKPPTLTEKFRLPTATVADIDAKFVLGAAAFGVGWGMGGVCPGPGLLRAIMQPAWGALWLGGFWLGSLLAS